MKSEDANIALQLIPINIGGPKGDDELKEFISAELSPAAITEIRFPPGTPIAAVGMWHVWLSDAAAVLAIGGLLWRGYQLLSEKKDAGSGPQGLHVSFKGDGHREDSFVIGKEVTDREQLIERLKISAERLKDEEEDA